MNNSNEQDQTKVISAANNANGTAVFHGNAKQFKAFVNTTAQKFGFQLPAFHVTDVVQDAAKPGFGSWDKMDKETKDKFRKAWAIYKAMCKEYKQDVLDGASQEAKPTIQDFRARVINKMNWKVGERRLSEVINYGESGVIQ